MHQGSEVTYTNQLIQDEGHMANDFDLSNYKQSFQDFIQFFETQVS